MLTAYTKNNIPLNPGDMVTSSRSGDTWRYLYALRITDNGKAGTVVVNRPEYDQDGKTEMSASVFGLTVRKGISPAPKPVTEAEVRPVLRYMSEHVTPNKKA